MNSIRISTRWAVRCLLVGLVVIALLITTLPATAQDPDPDWQSGDRPDPTAKRAPQVQGGVQPPPSPTIQRDRFIEDFESGSVPPPGWTRIRTNPNETWCAATHNPHGGSYHADVSYDPALLDQDEVLLSPTFEAGSGDVSLWSFGSLYWCRDTYDNCDLEVWFVKGSWDAGSGDDIYLGSADDDWTSTWTYSYSTFDLDPYADGNPARIAFRYVGNDGAEVSLDDIDIDVEGGDVGPMVYDGHTIDDDNNGNSFGDDDGVVEPGETIELYVTLRNQGLGTATGVETCISTTDPYVTFIYNTCSSYPNIPGGDTGINSDDFDFQVSSSTPDGHVIHFNLEITASSGGPWSDSFDVVVTSAQTQWTFLIYLDGDNNLESSGIDDFLEMASVGSTGLVDIVALFDRVPSYDSSYGNWTDARLFHITPGLEPWGYNGASVGEVNMGDPQTLIDFVQWGMSSYPAEHYAVVLWDHGSGWRLRDEENPLLKDVAYDQSSGGDAIDMPELLGAMDILSNGGSEPLDLVGFDACLMAMIEVDNQLIPYADVRAGSEESEPANGWPYDTILSALQGTPTMSASQLGTVIVDEYYASYGDDWTQSAVDLHSAYDTLNAATDALAQALINGVNSHYVEIATARGSAQEFLTPTYIDLYDFAHQLSQHVSDAAIDAAATDVMDSVDAAVIRERHGTDWAGARGISIYFPATEDDYNNDYDGAAGWLQFTADIQWDEWLHAFYSEVGCHDPHEPNGSPGQATPISYDIPITDPDICPAGDLDYYSFVGNEGDTIVADIDARAIGSALDSYLYLYDTDGTTELTHNDDSDGFDSRILYTLPADGTYYLKVEEYNHPNEGGPFYFYTLSLTRMESFDIYATSTSSPPAIDGQIASGEWDDAATYDITDVRTPHRQGLDNVAVLNLPQGHARQDEHPRALALSRDRLNPVTLYAMRDDSHLYLAMDNPNDTTVDDYDQIGVYFDDNPLPSDGQWTLTSCGNSDGEGNFWVVTDTVKYREWIAGPTACTVVVPAPGASGSLGYDSGHTQAEIAIDLTSSALRAAPGDTINMYMWIFDLDTYSYDGMWPIGAVYNDPSTYRPLTLAPPLATPNLSSPSDESNTCDTTPYFEWTSVSGATSYRIQVDNNASFGSPEVDTTVSATNYTPGSGLAPGTYRWRVRAIDGYQAGDWSSAWRVTISSTPGAPALSSPPHNETADDNPPTFRWNSVSGATGYRIQVDDNNDFSSRVENTTTTQTSYTPDSTLDAGTPYYWRVRASNVCGNGPWSGTWMFSTPAEAPTPPVYLPIVSKNH